MLLLILRPSACGDWGTGFEFRTGAGENRKVARHSHKLMYTLKKYLRLAFFRFPLAVECFCFACLHGVSLLFFISIDHLQDIQQRELIVFLLL